MNQSQIAADLLLAQKIIDDRDGKDWADKAWRIIEPIMIEDPDNPIGTLILSHLHMERNWDVVAYHLGHRAVDLAPTRDLPWTNLGRACKNLYKLEDAEICFKKALELTKNDLDKGSNMSNVAAILLDNGKFKEAEPICREAMKLNPNSVKAKGNLAYSLLGQRRWRDAWPLYNQTLGNSWRIPRPWSDEPRPETAEEMRGKRVLVWGEQGLGDEISFASMFRDAHKDISKDGGRMIIECSPKLDGLFRRSFGDIAKVYGTRPIPEKLKIMRDWDEEDEKPDLSLPAGHLGGFYRNEDADFPRVPYLTADPERRAMWRALFDSKKKPCIGIAWSGGVSKTGGKVRRFSLDAMLPVFRAVDAHWVCLQYQDATEELAEFKEAHGIEIAQYKWATLSMDYDDTASLVAELDSIVAMQTAVIHLAGALGVKSRVILPMNSQWRYGEGYDDMLWYPETTKLYRQKGKNDWGFVSARIAREIRAEFAKAETAAG